MELKRAKEVLADMNMDYFSKDQLLLDCDRQQSLVHNVASFEDENGKFVHIYGEYKADQLEAIATWMRDPEGVVKA